MKLMELICQGLKGSQEIKKFAFAENYNLLDSSKEGFSTRQALKEVIYSALYPSYEPSSEDFKGASSKARLGVTFSHSGDLYRFVRDLSRRAFSLSRFDKVKSVFDEISRETGFVEQAFSDSFKVPRMEDYELLYTVDRDSIARLLASGSKGPQKADDSAYFAPLEEDADRARKSKRLKELTLELKNIEMMREIEFELDGLQGKLFEVSDKISKLKGREEEIKGIARELEEYVALDCLKDFPKDIEKRLKDFDGLEEKKNAELSSLDTKMEELIAEQAALKISPVYRDAVFVLSVILSFLALVGAVFFERFRLAFVLSFVVPLAGCAWRLIDFFRKREREKSLNKEIMEVRDSKGVIDKKHEIETSLVKKFFAKTQLNSADDALFMIKKKRELEERFKKETEQYEETKRAAGFNELNALKERLSGDIALREERLRSMPSVSMDPNDLAKEVQALRAEIGEDPLASGVRTVGQNADLGPCARMMECAVGILKTERARLRETLKQSLSTNLKVLTAGYFTGVDFDGKDAAFFDFGSKKGISFDGLDPDQKTAIIFAMKFTMMQLLAKYLPMPCVVSGVIEISGVNLDKRIFLQAASHLAKQCQVIHIV